MSIRLAYSFGNSVKLDKYQMAVVASEFITVTFPFKVNFRLHQMFNSNLIFAIVGSQLSTSMLPKRIPKFYFFRFSILYLAECLSHTYVYPLKKNPEFFGELTLAPDAR